MNIKLLTFLLVLNLCQFHQDLSAQTVQKSTLSGFSNISANDSVYVAAGQIEAGESLTPRVLHGYFPFQYSLVNLDHEDASQFSVYPNPVNDICYIDFKDNGNYRVEILNIQGQVVLRDQFIDQNATLNLSTFSRGLYFVVIYQGESVVFNQKLIKH